jgi:DNA invertase Pin-like site-specific DNA recombinase
MKTACAYFRTSSATNVGNDKDSLKRQQEAVRAFADRSEIQIVHEYYDAAVSGADPVDSRAGFCEMVTYMMGNGARTVLVETANRFARDLIVQETGHKMLKAKGIELIAVDSPDSFTSDTPTADFIRQVLGAVAQLEKAMLVAKLRGARERKRRETGRCEGKPPAPVAAVEAARAARSRGLSLRAVATELEVLGFKRYGAGSVAHMLK